MNEDALYNTPSFRYKAKIIPLINVLDELFNITFFHFGRVHYKLGKLTIGNSLNFAPRYWNEYVIYDSTFHQQRIKSKNLIIYNGESTSLTKKEQEMYYVRLHEYNLAPEGIILIKHHPEYIDTFNFSSIKYERDAINTLIQCIPDLNKYCDFFLDQVKDILSDKNNYTLSNYQQKVLFAIDESVAIPAVPRYLRKRGTSTNPMTNKFIKEHLEGMMHIQLSKIELACLYWVAQGKTAAETAELLYKSPRTVEGHLSDIRLKLGCSKTSAAIAKAEKLGLIDTLSPLIIKTYTN